VNIEKEREREKRIMERERDIVDGEE